MSKNIVFCFSGTGNSLHVAKQVAQQMDAVVRPMAGKAFSVPKETQTIGFVYPTYFGGLPRQVKNYISALSIPPSAYTYAIATYGGMYGNGISDLHALLKNKQGGGLHYGSPLYMPGNYIVMYPMETDHDKTSGILSAAQTALTPIIQDIAQKKTSDIKNSNWLLGKYTTLVSKNHRAKDKDFTVTDSCTQCNRCVEICPVENIAMQATIPKFHGKCEQCMSCIQTCPVKAINYKNKTNAGERYFNPAVTAAELIQFNHGTDVAE